MGKNAKDFAEHVHEGFEDFAKTVEEKDASKLPEWDGKTGRKEF